MMQMEQYLLRNHETRKYLQEQAYRLQQGIVTTTTQQAGTATHTHTHIFWGIALEKVDENYIWKTFSISRTV